MMKKGKVYLVGAGPGDPGLLTLRGAQLLGLADIVIYDGLASREILMHARPGAEMVYGGKHDRSRAMSQEQINELMIEHARQGKCVIRLKGGDPYVLGRGGEEAEFLAKSGISFEVVPGVSSAEAVPSYAGIPLTHREYANSYTVITGHENPCHSKKGVDWAKIVEVPGTLVILMGLTKLRTIAESLMHHGKSKDTPVAVVQWGATNEQRTVEGNLATIAGLVEEAKLAPPAVIVIGDVVKLRSTLNWFEKRSLARQKIVVTRARDQAAALVKPLCERGADVLEIPTIKIAPVAKTDPIIEALAGINEYDWIIFTSVNGVNAFFDLFFKSFQDMRDIGGVRIAAVGSATAARLKELHLQVDVVPSDFEGAKIAKAMSEFMSVENLRVLLLRAEVANPELPKLLQDLGAIVDDVPCYHTEPETKDITGAGKQLMEEGADWVTFTSGSTVQNFHARFPLQDLIKRFPHIQFATIGPETSKVLQSLGCKPSVEAQPHTIEAMIQAIEKKVVSDRQ